ncbi:hypothetical protein CBR_g18864 [Chara braunii]|uniref:Uncharacterized protein n=1 Tax=Chara braunii TaxID=69332 RepID=A0A388KWW9_CHABU|nr:hypothetical protein CBR_g18864 [Chara braunii]|eukprot:GBG74453.1 hypothetical protein CBR_g18864 [Chara braunii]
MSRSDIGSFVMEPAASMGPASSLSWWDMASPADIVGMYKQQICEAIEVILQAEGKLPLLILHEVDGSILEWWDVLQQIASSLLGTLHEEPATSDLQECFLQLEELQQITAQQLAAITIGNLPVDVCCPAALGVWEETDGGAAPPLPTSSNEIFVEGQDLSAALGAEGDNCNNQLYIDDTNNDTAVAPTNNDNNNNNNNTNNNNNNNNNNDNMMAANEDDGGRQNNGRKLRLGLIAVRLRLGLKVKKLRSNRRGLQKLCLGLKVKKLKEPIISKLANSSETVMDRYVEGVQVYFRLEAEGKVERVLHSLTFLVEDNLPFDVLLGMDWGEAAHADLKLREHECWLPSPQGGLPSVPTKQKHHAIAPRAT